MAERSNSGIHVGHVVVLLIIVALSVALYIRARDSEDGTSVDDSPAAEIGAKSGQ